MKGLAASALAALALTGAASANVELPPTGPDPYPGSTAPVTEDYGAEYDYGYAYVAPRAAGGTWRYCAIDLAPGATSPAECQPIPHPPFDPDLLAIGVG